jgi:competence protein ComEC
MGWGIDATIRVAEWVAVLPGNIWSVPRLPTFGVVLVALGGSWLCLWQGRWRVWGTIGIAAGIATLLFARPPDIILADFGHVLAARMADGDYRVAATADGFDRSFLADEAGARLLPFPASGTAAGALDCSDAGRCFYTAEGRRVALVSDAAGLPIACHTVDAIVAQVPAGFACRDRGVPVADRIDNWRYGAIGLWLSADGVVMESANQSRGDRPWVPRPLSRRDRAAAALRN